MIELSVERINKILHEETAQREELSMIVRGIYTRYMRMYEEYFADIDALNDDKIAAFKKQNEETKSLMKYYYLDIPLDVFEELMEFDHEYNDKLLGPDWHTFLFERYKEFKEQSMSKNDKALKAEFAKEALAGFYESMDDLFRDCLGTNSQTAKETANGIWDLLFGNDK
jgi:hypothetical protein